MITINQLAENLSHMFKFKEDIQKKVFNEDIVNDEVRDMFLKAGMEVDDYHYRWLDHYMDEFAYALGTDGPLDLESLHEELIGNIEADVYTSDITEWLNSINSRVYYLTEALEDFDIKDGFQLISYAQYLEIREVYQMGLEVIKNYIEYMGGLEEGD